MSRPLRWLAARSLHLYPRRWQQRYAGEVTLVLAEHRVSLWTVCDLVLGAVDAHAHPELLPEDIMSTSVRWRTSEIAVFCACVLFGLAWLPVLQVRDPLPAWLAASAAHPQLLYTLDAVQLSGLVVVLALLCGGVPLVCTGVARAVAGRQWHAVRLFLVPCVMAVAVALFAVFASPYWSQPRASATPSEPFTPLAIVLQLALFLLVFVAIVASCAALGVAVQRTVPSERAVRLATVPASAATAAIGVGLLATLLLGVLASDAAPDIFSTGSALVCATPMAIAFAVACLALRRAHLATRAV